MYLHPRGAKSTQCPQSGNATRVGMHSGTRTPIPSPTSLPPPRCKKPATPFTPTAPSPLPAPGRGMGVSRRGWIAATVRGAIPAGPTQRAPTAKVERGGGNPPSGGDQRGRGRDGPVSSRWGIHRFNGHYWNLRWNRRILTPADNDGTIGRISTLVGD